MSSSSVPRMVSSLGWIWHNIWLNARSVAQYYLWMHYSCTNPTKNDDIFHSWLSWLTICRNYVSPTERPPRGQSVLYQKQGKPSPIVFPSQTIQMGIDWFSWPRGTLPSCSTSIVGHASRPPPPFLLRSGGTPFASPPNAAASERNGCNQAVPLCHTSPMARCRGWQCHLQGRRDQFLILLQYPAIPSVSPWPTLCRADVPILRWHCNRLCCSYTY